jgi:hypothetical protein
MKIAGQIQFSDIALFSYPLAVLLLRALMQEFARASQAIIHPALKSKKLPDLSTIRLSGADWNRFRPGWDK